MSDLLDPEVFRTVMEDLQVGVYFTDRNRRIVFWNSGAERITGYLRQEVVGRCCREQILLHCDHLRTVICATCCPLAEALADGKPKESSLFLQHKSGHRVPIRVHTMPIRNAGGAIIGAAECFQRQRYLPHPERRDAAINGGAYAFSGIPDYSFMISELRMRLARLNEVGPAFGVLCLQVDRLDHLRESRGQEACETVLHVTANTLQNTMRPEDCLGAWKDRRLMLVLGSASHDAAARAGERLRALVACSGVVWWGDPVPVSISLGGTMVKTGDTMELVVRRAEQALEESVRDGGNRVTVSNE